MYRRPSSPLAAALFALALIIGGSACSSDGGSAEPVSTTSGADETAGGESSGDGGGEGEGRAFGIDRSGLAVALASATSADDHSVEGSTIVLVFNDGSKDDPRAHVNCSAATTLAAADDEVVLRYPDGTLACADLDRGFDS